MFYRVLDCIYGRCGTQDIVIANVDLNVMSENEQDPLNKVVGTYGLGERNERSDLWVEMMFVKRSSDNKGMVRISQQTLIWQCRLVPM